jgi:signal recognition particle GTPase
MIDTLEFARRMIESGMSEQTAERLAHELRDVLPESQAVTKTNRTEFEKLRTEVRAEVEKVRTDVEKLRTDFANLKVWVLLIVGIGQVSPPLLQLARGFWKP